MQMQEKKVKGFSLLELLVVVAIIGVISAVSFTPFMKWRSDRIVRTEAINVTSVIQNIFSQVQRGNYSFVQFKIQKSGDEYHVSSNGMGIERFTDLVRDKGDEFSPNPFHDFTTRCSSLEVNLTWDHQGSIHEDVLTVNKIEIDATKIELGVEGTEVSEGTVCFSKDGTYYSPGGDFIDDSSPIERLFICSKGSAAKCNEDGGENTFALAWSRFGNISLKKYNKKFGWIEQ